MRFFGHVRFQFAEARAECHEIFLVQVLPANHDNNMIEKGLVDRAKGGVVQGFDIDAVDFSADFGRGWSDFQHEVSLGNIVTVQVL